MAGRMGVVARVQRAPSQPPAAPNAQPPRGPHRKECPLRTQDDVRRNKERERASPRPRTDHVDGRGGVVGVAPLTPPAHGPSSDGGPWDTPLLDDGLKFNCCQERPRQQAVGITDSDSGGRWITTNPRVGIWAVTSIRHNHTHTHTDGHTTTHT
jgi:hypothetical protein